MTFAKERGISSVIGDPRADPLLPTPFRKASHMSKKSLRIDNSSKILLKNVYEKRLSTKSALNSGRPGVGYGLSLDLKEESPLDSARTRNHIRSGRSLSLAHDPSVLKINTRGMPLSPSRNHLNMSPTQFSQHDELAPDKLGHFSIKLPAARKPSQIVDMEKLNTYDSNLGTFENYTQKLVQYGTNPKQSPYLKGKRSEIKLPAI
jgi:hypothetical protein